MSTEKAGTEVHHDISNDNRPSHEIQYPVVAEGTGKTLDEAHGAKAKEVHNVSSAVLLASICIRSQQLIRLETIGRVLRRRPGVQDREVEQELHQAVLRRLHRLLLRLCQRL